MLQTRALQFAYPGSSPFAFPDLTAAPEQPLLILGQSGVGKTTLLHLLGGLLQPQQGQILIDETDLAELGTQARDRFRGRNIGLVFQQAHFVQALTVRRNLQLAQYLAATQPDDARIQALLDRLGIGEQADRLPKRLSLGEQQRVSIARAVINRPRLLLADEPTSALDDHHAQEVIQLLLETAREAEASLVIVTHDQRLKAHVSAHVALARRQAQA